MRCESFSEYCFEFYSNNIALRFLAFSQSKHFDNEYQTFYWHNTVTGQSIWCDEEETSSDTDAASPENKPQKQAVQQPSSPDKKTSVDEKAELKNTSLTVSDYDSDLPQYKSGRKFRKLPLTEMTDSENGIELNGLNPMNSINGTTVSYSANNLNSNSNSSSGSSSQSNLNLNYSNNDTDSPVYEASDSLFRPEENESGNGIEIGRAHV